MQNFKPLIISQAVQHGLCRTWSETLDRFYWDMAHLSVPCPGTVPVVYLRTLNPKYSITLSAHFQYYLTEYEPGHEKTFLHMQKQRGRLAAR